MITKIMIAEDNMSTYLCYRNFLSKDETIEIVDHTKDGISTIEKYKEKNPDILILDLDLPNKNGLEVLEELIDFEKDKPKCNVIVVSGRIDLIHQLLKTRKVLIVIPKPAPYSSILSAIRDFQKEQILDSFSEKKCNEILLKLNLNPYSRNGRILIDAIRICYCDYELSDNLNNLYQVLGCMNSCSPQKIKSSIRSIIDTVNRSSNFELLNSIFYSEEIDKYKGISPKHFINGMIVCLRN